MKADPKGLPGAFKPIEEVCGMDAFENAIRAVGVVSACEWFGRRSSDTFTRETIELFSAIEQGTDPRQ